LLTHARAGDPVLELVTFLAEIYSGFLLAFVWFVVATYPVVRVP
jgi:hypothetical protein